MLNDYNGYVNESILDQKVKIMVMSREFYKAIFRSGFIC
jgi:hypothetical protein